MKHQPQAEKRQPLPAYPFSKHYIIHGMGLNIESNAPHIIELLHQALYPFEGAGANAPCPRIQFRLRENPEIDAACIQGLEPVSFCMEMTYYSRDSRLFTHIPARFLAQADLDRLTVLCDISPSYTHNQWFIFHQVFFPILAETLKHLHIFNIHTAALANGEQGILFPAQARSGKSTLSIKLLEAGFNFLSDDICFLTRDSNGLRLLGFPEPIQIWEETRRFFPNLNLKLHPEGDCPNLKKSLRADELFPEAIRTWARPRFLVIPQIIAGESSHLDPLAKTEALQKLIPQSLMVANRNIVGQHLKILTDLVSACDCYRLQMGSDIEQVPALIRQLF